MDVTKPYEFIGFGAMDVTKPYEFIGFGAKLTDPYVSSQLRVGVSFAGLYVAAAWPIGANRAPIGANRGSY